MSNSPNLEPATVQTINEIRAAWVDQERMQNSTHFADCHNYHLGCAITKLLHTINDLCVIPTDGTSGQ